MNYRDTILNYTFGELEKRGFLVVSNFELPKDGEIIKDYVDKHNAFVVEDTTAKEINDVDFFIVSLEEGEEMISSYSGYEFL